MILRRTHAEQPTDAHAIAALDRASRPIRGQPSDWDALLELIGDHPVVLLGEASHGTREFYEARTAITMRLIREKGFSAVAVEADWPDAYRVNRYVHGRGRDGTPEQALGDFERFPQWMWRNHSAARLVQQLRDENQGRPPHAMAGFYGLDLYSMHRSAAAVVAYLEQVDPEAARMAAERYGCLDHRDEDPQRYGMEVTTGLRRGCHRQVIDQLIDLRRHADEYLKRDGLLAEDEQFYAEQNARVVHNAERYYRNMFGERENTWNLRDQHMADTLESLRGHLMRQGRSGKVVVWAHNSHLGDARATDMGRRGEHNLGQLVREKLGGQAVLVGFTTHRGEVSAASDWGGDVERKRVRDAIEGSYEDLIDRAAGGDDRLLILRNLGEDDRRALSHPRLERMIGVIYRPRTERWSHYFDCELARQFDAVVHYSHTHAVEPIDPTAGWRSGEPAETYPFGL